MNKNRFFLGLASLGVLTALTGCGRVVVDDLSGSGQDSVKGTGHGPGSPPSGIVENCDTPSGYEINGFDKAPGQDGVPLLLVGVYETNATSWGSNHPQGTFNVTVNTPGSQYLALSAYEPTEWTVQAGPDTKILGVYAIGYHEQDVVAPAGTPVVSESYEGGGDSACGYSWPYNGEGCDTAELVDKIEGMADRPVSTFRGCYKMSELTFLP